MKRLYIVGKMIGGMVLAGWLASGCSTPRPDSMQNKEALDASVPEGSARVVLFNDSDDKLYMLTGTITVLIDGRQIAVLKRDQFTQVFLPKGKHQLSITHRDVVRFQNEYDLDLGKDENFLRLYCRPASTTFDPVDELPLGFTSRYNYIPAE